MDPRTVYREVAVQGASPVRLVIMLYDQAIEDLRRALAAFAQGDVEGRTRAINHALLVAAHLQATLDKQQGGQVATNLERFYNQFRASLVDAQFRQSPTAVEQQLALLITVRDAWIEVERDSAASALTVQEPHPAASAAERHQEWDV